MNIAQNFLKKHSKIKWVYLFLKNGSYVLICAIAYVLAKISTCALQGGSDYQNPVTGKSSLDPVSGLPPTLVKQMYGIDLGCPPRK